MNRTVTLAELYRRYFRLVFQAASPKTRGSEEDYRDWAYKFYRGRFLVIVGWETHVRNAPPLLRPRMVVLGQRVCGEWAKPSGVGAVSTDDVKRWGVEMQDNPNLPKINALIDLVEKMLPEPLIPTVPYDHLKL